MKTNIKDFLEIIISRGFIHQTTDIEDLKKIILELLAILVLIALLIPTCWKPFAINVTEMVTTY